MKALTIRQPYADAIVLPSGLPKRIENRGWPLPARHVGVPRLLHSAAAPERKPVLPDAWAIPRLYGDHADLLGVILAQVTFTGCHFDGDGCDDNCSTWGFRETYHWRIADVTALPEPVPAKGALGFWTPTPDVLAAVEAQLSPTT